ncbi:expressed unknown protein [Seminavis robusta]|uniref:Uncharacterized protein n=1 Tax=Seminavis robusta TaxID=568900 RepID=A0A9N8H7D1_9STRA|nr:expressed unknown protein [Seminavis robusta]|eukprot:Sro125_g060230.1 n/a (156) ;mRNA; r:58098-58565
MVDRVDRAISKAMELVRSFSERDPHDHSPTNPWKDPQEMLEKLDRARENILTAQQEAKQPANVEEIDRPDDNDFRAAYMDMITDSFGDVLEGMRTSGDEELDVDVLVDCLQSGMDLMSSEDVELFMMDDDEDIEEDNTPTPHEKRRLQLGIPSEC